MNKEEKLILRELYSSANADQRVIIEKLLPELKESKDERIRKEIIEYLKYKYESPNAIKCDYEKWIAWLEKQGEQISDEREDWISIPFGAFDSELIEETIIIPDGYVATIEGDKVLIKKQGEPKPTDKEETKFKVGDWV